MAHQLASSVNTGGKVAPEYNEIQTPLHLCKGQREDWGVRLDPSNLGVRRWQAGFEHGLPLTLCDLISMIGTRILLGSPLLLVQSLVGVVGSPGALSEVEEVVLVPGHAQHLSAERVDRNLGVANHGALLGPESYFVLPVECAVECSDEEQWRGRDLQLEWEVNKRNATRDRCHPTADMIHGMKGGVPGQR